MGTSVASPTILKQNSGASKIGTASGDDLQTKLDSLAAADSALSDAIGDEETARAAADSALSDAIGDEETAREAADSALADSIAALDSAKQDNLVSGDNIKTINGESLLGSEDIEIKPLGEVVAVNTLSGDGVSEFSLSSDYDYFEIVIYGLAGSGSTTYLVAQLSSDDGATWRSDLQYMRLEVASSSASVNNATSQSNIQLLSSQFSSSSLASGKLVILSPGPSGTRTFFSFSAYSHDRNQYGGGYTAGDATVDKVRIAPGAGTFSGTMVLKGYKNE